MQILKLQPGQVFVECDETEWAQLSKRDKARTPRATYERFLGLCKTSHDRIHVRTSRGDWCIHEDSPVTVVYQSSARVKQEEAA